MSRFKLPLLTFLGLLSLLAVSVLLNRLTSAAVYIPLVLGIAIVMAALVFTEFMGLRNNSALTRVFALGGLLWWVLMIVLTLSDYLTR